MKYRRFIIENYRAITGPLIIDLEKKAPLPLIGVNESGKTTILHAVFAFDYHNDSLNKGRHLQDTANLYRTTSAAATVTAEIILVRSDFAEALNEIATEAPDDPKVLRAVRTYRRKKSSIPKRIPNPTQPEHPSVRNTLADPEQRTVE